jgi:hypothetical protein
MCIIAWYKKGTTADRETVKRMMTTNGDGVGIAWNTGRAAYMKKGFEKVDEVCAFLDRLRADKHVNDIIFHARIATSGGISAEKCHPFPLSADNDTLNKTQYGTRGALVFHNGVFSIDIENGLNDSQTYIKRVLYPLARLDSNGVRNGRFDEILRMSSAGSRLLLLYPDGVKTFGTWTESEGVLYSNTGFRPWTYYGNGARSYYYGWTADEWDEWEEIQRERRAAASAQKRKNAKNGGAETGAKFNASWWEKHGKNEAVKGGADGKQSDEKKAIEGTC